MADTIDETTALLRDEEHLSGADETTKPESKSVAGILSVLLIGTSLSLQCDMSS